MFSINILSLKTLILVFVLMVFTPLINAELLNPSFETGTLSPGWWGHGLEYGVIPGGQDANYHFMGKSNTITSYACVGQNMDLTGVDNISFWYKSSIPIENFWVGVGASRWYPTKSATWAFYEFDVSSFSGSQLFQIRGWSANGWKYIYIDNVRLDGVGYDPTSTLSGTVTSSASGTIEGVSVSLNNSGGSDTTNETGYYEITGVNSSIYLLTATSATHEEYTDVLNITSNTVENFQMIRLLPEIVTYNTEEEPTSIQLNFIGNGVTDSVNVYRDSVFKYNVPALISGNYVDSGLTVGETYEYCLTPYDGSISGTQICFDASTVSVSTGSPVFIATPETPSEPEYSNNESVFDSIIDPIFDIIDPIIEFISESTSQLMEPLEDLMEPIIEPVQSTYEEITHTTETSSFLFILFAYFGALVASLLLFYSIESKINTSTILLSGTIGWIIPLLITFSGIICLVFTEGILTGLVFAVFGFTVYVLISSISSEENMPGRIK